MKVEYWKPIPGYLDLYEISSFGRVKSLKYGKVRILKLFKKKDGYLQVQLWENHNYKNFKVHRLVYEAFNGTIPDGMQVNHINEDKTDNRLENLNLMTPKENANWGTRTIRQTEKVKGVFNTKLSKPVLQFTLDGVFVREWPSSNEAGRNGFAQSHITDCCIGKYKKHKGYKWAYKNE